MLVKRTKTTFGKEEVLSKSFASNGVVYDTYQLHVFSEIQTKKRNCLSRFARREDREIMSVEINRQRVNTRAENDKTRETQASRGRRVLEEERRSNVKHKRRKGAFSILQTKRAR